MPWVKASAVTHAGFVRVYPQAPDEDQEIDFIWRVQAEFPWVVETGTQVHVRSSITDTP